MQARTSLRLALAVVAVLPSIASFADDSKRVSPVVVTATRTAQTADESLASVTVITREDIENSGQQSLPDLLERQRGVSVSSNGAFGKSTSVFMRGTNSDHVLVLVNGIKLGSATTGTTAFQHLPLEQIERVEIVRGPRSSLYGSEAIGGVIQIFTRRGESGDPSVDASVLAGEHDTGEIEATFSGGDKDTRYALSAKTFDTDGISARSDAFPDDDGYRSDSASLDISQDFGDTTTWSLSALTADGNTEFDGCFRPNFTTSQDCETEFNQQVLSTTLELQVLPAWSTRITAGQSRDDTTNFTEGAFFSEFDTERDEFSWQNDFTIGARNLVTVGVDYRDDKVDSNEAFDEDSRDNTAVFAQWQWAGTRTDLQVSVRHDDNEAFDEETTGSIAAGYAIDDRTRVYGSVGTGFKAPTFNDLFFPDDPFFVSNPDLDPEESTSVEIGVEGGRGWRWSINAFHTRIDDIIVFNDPDGFPGPTPGTMENLSEADINGLELSAGGVHGGWDLQVDLTLLDTEADTDDANDGNELPRRPDRVFSVSAQRDFGRASFAANTRHESTRFDDPGNNTKLDDFIVVDFRVGYEIDTNLVVQGTIENALDEEYQTVDGFNTLDRSVFVRLSYQPQ